MDEGDYFDFDQMNQEQTESEEVIDEELWHSACISIKLVI